MRRLRSFGARFGRDEGGSTLVEFAFILTPMCVILVGGLEFAYNSYARTLMQGALNDAARRASVQYPVFDSFGADIEEKVENSIRDIVGSMAQNAEITVEQESFYEFSNVGRAEKLITDHNDNGQYDEEDDDCWEDANDNGEFDTDTGVGGRGKANDVVFYRANISMPRLFPIDKLLPIESEYSMTLETAVRNQPYGNRPEPPILCGDDE